MPMKFIVDANVGKLTKWLRLMGHDAIFFDGRNDGDMIALAFSEDRTILTRDTHIMEWGVVKSGRVKTLLIENDDPETQICQVLRDLHIEVPGNPFTVCLECNVPLVDIAREDVKNRVPPYVFRTQANFLECPKCRRIYWRGTHWQSMVKRLENLSCS
jgi:uncharacterized protein with PIN domain